MSSGSVSSFNDEDYEVDENSDEEEQEEPGDYCKGSFRNVASDGLKRFYNSFRILYAVTAIFTRLSYAYACWDPEKFILHYSVAVNLAENFVDNATVDVSINWQVHIKLICLVACAKLENYAALKLNSY